MSTDHPLRPLFDPQSIAIIGASNDALKFGGRPIKYMADGGYKGRIYPVNPKGGEIQGLKAYADIREVPEIVDMVVISVPAPGVVAAIEACAAAKARSAVIFSSGFAEVGEEGAAWQRQLVEIARRTGIRLVGPNCMGMLNTESKAVGTFSSAFEHGWPREGNIALLSQSGAVGSHTMVLARERGLGVRGWVTTGNECDVDVADCIDYAAEDPGTKVISVYMEGCQHPDRFLVALQKAQANRKPVVVMKVGASEVGAAAASTHTASLAGADEVFDAVFRQYGVHRARTLEQLIDVSAAASAGQIPTGRKLGIVTISGGVGVLSSDTAVACGLEVPPLPAPAQKTLKELMSFAAVRNPVDTTAQVLNNLPLLRKNLEVILEQGGFDAVMVFLSMFGFSQRMMKGFWEFLPEVRAQFPDALMVMSMLCRPEDRARLEQMRFIVMEDPSRAIAAIAALAGFGESFARPPRLAPPAAQKVAIDGPLSEVEAAALLQRAGLPMLDARLAKARDEAVAAAEAVGFPVVAKIVSRDIAHKTDIGGVKLGLKDAGAVAAAFDAILAAARDSAPQARLDGVMVSPMVSGGVETIIGVHRDPVFGPTVLCGLGGVLVEVLKDVTFRVAPFGTDEAHRMIRELRGYALLEGVRGRPPADVDALADALARLSAFAAANADTVESIDINPLLVQQKGAVALDALIVGR
jgi:acyl-CoA synthetase (NDP forming)